MLFHTQQAPLKEGFHIKYNIDDMAYQKTIINKIIYHIVQLPDIATGHLLLRTVTGTGSLFVLRHDVSRRTKGA